MFQIIKLMIFILIISFSSNIQALLRNKLNTCDLTKSYLNNYEPEVFFPGNNLLRKAGQEKFYCGEKITLKLQILDKNCIPISDAKVFLWQVGCDGKYPYKPLRNRVNSHFISKRKGSSFVGSGIATTNNLGQAAFITLNIPIHAKEDAINIRIEHSTHGTFQTKIFPRKETIIEENGEDVIEKRITLPWVNLHRRF